MAIKILLVEDTAESRDILTILLEREGFDVAVASNGYEGIKNTFAEQPDLVITDLTMPGMNGVDMIKVLRSIEEFEQVPILAVTAYGIEIAQTAIAAGANRVLAQPLEAHTLLSVVEDLMKEKRSGQSASSQTTSS
jgi:CheY-like chemotaxis protein